MVVPRHVDDTAIGHKYMRNLRLSNVAKNCSTAVGSPGDFLSDRSHVPPRRFAFPARVVRSAGAYGVKWLLTRDRQQSGQSVLLEAVPLLRIHVGDNRDETR